MLAQLGKILGKVSGLSLCLFGVNAYIVSTLALESGPEILEAIQRVDQKINEKHSELTQENHLQFVGDTKQVVELAIEKAKSLGSLEPGPSTSRLQNPSNITEIQQDLGQLYEERERLLDKLEVIDPIETRNQTLKLQELRVQEVRNAGLGPLRAAHDIVVEGLLELLELGDKWDVYQDLEGHRRQLQEMMTEMEKVVLSLEGQRRKLAQKAFRDQVTIKDFGSFEYVQGQGMTRSPSQQTVHGSQEVFSKRSTEELMAYLTTFDQAMRDLSHRRSDKIIEKQKQLLAHALDVALSNEAAEVEFEMQKPRKARLVFSVKEIDQEFKVEAEFLAPDKEAVTTALASRGEHAYEHIALVEEGYHEALVLEIGRIQRGWLEVLNEARESRQKYLERNYQETSPAVQVLSAFLAVASGEIKALERDGAMVEHQRQMFRGMARKASGGCHSALGGLAH